MPNLNYDETNPISIEKYSQNLINKTFYEIISEYSNSNLIGENTAEYGEVHENKKRKGGLGEIIEECFFHYRCNNDSNADFNKAGVELKVTPYKINKNKSFSAKERLIITMIDYFSVIEEDFYSSHLWNKCKLMLLVYYLYDSSISNRLDYKINYSKLFTPPKEDLEIIKTDYNTIINKIKDGKAHELSESDTLYLGAATKSSSSSKRRGQPFSDVPAKPRAFSFKTSYMTYVLNKYIINNVSTYEPIVKDSSVLKNTNFKEYILSKINIYIGKSDYELCSIFNREYNNNKSQWIDLTFRMLGIKSNHAEEFIKANMVVKAIRLEDDNTIIENMSFPAFKFKELVQQTWEESDLYTYFNETSFLFVVYKKEGSTYTLKGSQIWNMPYDDYSTMEEGWNKIKNTIINGVVLTPSQGKSGKIIVKNNFPKKSDNRIIHIRPHAQKGAYYFPNEPIFNNQNTIGNISRDANELPDGRWMTTQSFWLNNSYILSQLETNLLK
ncbi:Sau3AI family type II restriction endonuclease [Clostridium septicum]|uniref:Sau3AI family type II restriction endonuclease n=1 Tax=Clostridium septicum TaxID=1504 RepID=UPI00272DE40E|nr:Sau3AI family type II restriction endonuclease [Clostridium septicum]WLF68939.1 Sau3AI family type II restriction endonuclease [Clostridium septicum]